MQSKLTGTGVAMVTPFRNDDSIDFGALKKLTEHIINGGVDFLVVMGTTGENPVLSEQEQTAVLDYITEVSEKKVPIVFGIAGNNTQAVVNRIKNTDFTNIDAILSATPYYNKPTQEGLYAHYKTIAGACPVPVILYNVPGRTSVNMNAETTLKLANNFENIIAVKEASGNLDQIMQIIKNKPEGFSVLSGDDTYTMPYIAMGMNGVISVTGNAYPKEFSDMVKASLKYDFKTAQKLHYKLLDLSNSLFREGNPGGVKAALEILGICEKHVRLPLASVSNETYEIIKANMKNI
ncbi:MAG: 4-hydroxy-tetrahydrodipicolinate synthase [Bacteroidales bacterium]|nr:4-hydroxy-tetrahydrodipicolinate synthase [Bacteroidales bacterium]